jgi:hypothetical protein
MSYLTSTYINVSSGAHPMNRIFDIFGTYLSSLSNQEAKARQALDDWSTALYRQIQDHVSQQRQLILKTYQIQREGLENMRQQFVDATIIYERSKKTEEIDRLLEKCKNLKVDLVKFGFYSRSTEFIQVTPVKLPELMDQDDFNSGKSEKPLTESEKTEFEYNRNSNLSSRSTTENYDQIK